RRGEQHGHRHHREPLEQPTPSHSVSLSLTPQHLPVVGYPSQACPSGYSTATACWPTILINETFTAPFGSDRDAALAKAKWPTGLDHAWGSMVKSTGRWGPAGALSLSRAGQRSAFVPSAHWC